MIGKRWQHCEIPEYYLAAGYLPRYKYMIYKMVSSISLFGVKWLKKNNSVILLGNMSMCLDYLFAICQRNPCKYAHCLVICKNRNCTNLPSCKYFHLSKTQCNELKKNIRPYNQSEMREVDRVCFAILRSISEQRRSKLCVRLFSGKMCGHNCEACVANRTELNGEFEIWYF